MENSAFDRCVDFMTEMLLKYGGISIPESSTVTKDENKTNEDAA